MKFGSGVMEEGPLPRLVQTSQPEFWNIEIT
jgi:hypothetical protein